MKLDQNVFITKLFSYPNLVVIFKRKKFCQSLLEISFLYDHDCINSIVYAHILVPRTWKIQAASIKKSSELNPFKIADIHIWNVNEEFRKRTRSLIFKTFITREKWVKFVGGRT